MSRKAASLTHLIDIAKAANLDGRGALFRGVADVFISAPERCSGEALSHLDAILCALATQVETDARRDIAGQLAGMITAPKGLMRALAFDDIAIAAPVLERSLALAEEDLLAVIAERGEDHLAAIAARPGLTIRLSDEIVRRGESAVLAVLASNREALIGPETMEELVARARLHVDLQAPLTRRLDLTPDLLTQMYFFVSSALKKEILRRSERLAPLLVEKAVETNRRSIVAFVEAGGAPEGELLSDFIRNRIADGRINESLIKSLITERRHEDFLVTFSYYVGVNAEAGRRIIDDPNSEAFAIACRAVRMDRPDFARILFSLPQNARDQKKAVRVLDLYLKIPEEAAERVMRFWRMRAATPTADAEDEYGARGAARA